MILCELHQIVSSTCDLTFAIPCHRTTVFTSLWTSATKELSPFIEQDVPESILKVSLRKLLSHALLIDPKGKDNLGET